MTSFLSIAQEMNSRFNDQMVKFFKPMFECFNLQHFWFYKLTDDGFVSFGNSHAAWNEFFSAKQYWLTYPHICHPKFHKSGVYLHKNVEEFPLKEIWLSGADRFQICQSVAIVNKTPSGIEEFGFSSSSLSLFQTSTMLNEVPLFRVFFEKFKLEHPKLISSAEDNQINIAQIMGDAFGNNTVPIQNVSKKEELLKSIGFECRLSLREFDVIRLLLLGYSAGKIGDEVHLSRRTVEHHVERIKDKLGCDSKVDLIQKARELEQLGFFSRGLG